MHTPTHLLVSSALLSKSPYRSYWPWITFGALLPDLPMFGFYAYYKATGTPESLIWGELYFLPGWQNFFDIFNSLPLAAFVALAGYYLRQPAVLAFALSVLLHLALDLPLHNDDAHRHFFPFSDWRFISPLSYWDSAHHGSWVAIVELLVNIVCLWFLLAKGQMRAWRIVGYCGLVSLIIQVGIVLYWQVIFT